jgi:copper homeostasis protein
MEVCVDSVESALNAYHGHANRIELCSSLNDGGLTPSYGLYKTIKNHIDKLNQSNDTSFKINCMIRCRPGDFNYSDYEIENMICDLNKFVDWEVDGLVFGALTPDGYVDEDLMREFLKLVPSNIQTTFHRAFDVCVDWKACFEQLELLGFDKLLTSGQEKTAYDGRKLIAQLVSLSEKAKNEDRKAIEIVAGAGIIKSNLHELLSETKCKEFHASCRTSRNSNMSYKKNISMGSQSVDEFIIKYTDLEIVKELSDIYRKFYKA